MSAQGCGHAARQQLPTMDKSTIYNLPRRAWTRALALLACVAVACTMGSCGDTESEYSQAQCSLTFDNSVHNDAVLASAMTPYSGTYVTITTKTTGGARYFVFESNQGTTSNVIFNELDKRRTIILGYNGAIIVGYGSSVDDVFYAYDRECPNCFSPDSLPLRSRPLTVDEQGFAHCSNCNRSYNLNNGGIVSDGDGGNKMTRYRASTTGPYGVLNVY
jgi:hypothetical protein